LVESSIWALELAMSNTAQSSKRKRFKCFPPVSGEVKAISERAAECILGCVKDFNRKDREGVQSTQRKALLFFASFARP